ncbi:MAG: endonuclease III [Armatimonadota bacterium]|nr:endonuclease III [bacterium]MDW8320824.1 endonuclease III [Armatimonadota bacterium]
MLSPPELAREVVRRLDALHGRPVWRQRMPPLEELVACILSQHTSDSNSWRAYQRLRERFPSWQAVMDAPTEEVEEAIRPGGLASSKAPRIQAVLRAIAEHNGGALSLDFLQEMDTDSARRYLLGLPGVGPKTAAIVLCFSLGRPVIPVDTHVFRVSWRLGFFDRKVGEAKAHDLLQQIVPKEDIYPFHVHLIRHGRQVCKAQRPRCNQCPLADLCAYRQRTIDAPALAVPEQFAK